MNDIADYGETLDWDEVKAAASSMFNVWVDGEEFEWAKECWGHFKKSGLTSRESLLEDTLCRLRLLTLALIYQEFCVLAWDEDQGLSICELAEDLEIDSLILGILAGKDCRDEISDFGEMYEIEEVALNAACSPLRQEIFDCLCKAYGGGMALYSRMSHTSSASRPEDDEFDIETGNDRALDYVTSGFK
jgi:hypothetical protein